MRISVADVIAVLVVGAILGVLIYLSVSADIMRSYEITDMYEDGGKCYLQVEIEVTPEEYIGYDIGDEYEVEE